MTDSTATWTHITPGATASGPPVAVLNVFSPDVGSRPRFNLDFSFYDTGLTLGANLGLCDIDGGACLTDGPFSTLIQSGEQFLDASSNALSRNVQHGSFDITDPPATLAFNSNAAQQGPTRIPEPATLLLVVPALLGLAASSRRRRGR
jgi:hypothetical protein